MCTTMGTFQGHHLLAKQGLFWHEELKHVGASCLLAGRATADMWASAAS